MKPELLSFNSVEEVKEFISNNTDADTLGVISVIGPDGVHENITVNEFIKRVGLDEAARYIYENTGNMTGIKVTAEEIAQVIKKFKDDPNSLTEDEKMILFVALNVAEQGKFNLKDTAFEFFTMFTKMFVDTDCPSYRAITTILCGYLEAMLISSTELNKYANSVEILEEIINNIKTQITIPEGVNESMLLLTLLRIVTERVLNSKVDYNPNYKALVNNLGLDEDFIFDECEEDFSEEEHHETIDMTIKKSDMDKIFKDCTQTLKEQAEQSKAKNAENIEVKPDIRKSLKEDRK